MPATAAAVNGGNVVECSEPRDPPLTIGTPVSSGRLVERARTGAVDEPEGIEAPRLLRRTDNDVGRGRSHRDTCLLKSSNPSRNSDRLWADRAFYASGCRPMIWA
jgi:hypothetical protein